MNRPASSISREQVEEFLNEVFDYDVHAKRIQSLAGATEGAIHAASLGVSAIGRALAVANELTPRHAIKQVDRLLSNPGLNVWDLFRHWVPYLLAERTEAVIALDWTDFEKDGHHTIVASLVTTHGRTTPLMWKTHPKPGPKGAQTQAEDELLAYLRELVPPTVSVTVLADRGFGDTSLFAFLDRLDFKYVIRVRDTYYVTDESGERRQAKEWIGKGGQARQLRKALVTGLMQPVESVVCVRRKGMAENWCLVSSFSDATSTEQIKLYGRRFTIEESFRDVKDIRFGMGLGHFRIGSVERRDRILLISALAISLLTLLGAAGEAVGLDMLMKANTVKTRTHSLFNQGCFYYQWMATMREKHLVPLVQKFAELLRAQAVYREAFGLI
jgi:hypothetical protein